MKLKNIFLTTALIAFAVGFSDVGESVFWYLSRPVGAILFMLFMIFTLLEKEAALFDDQNGSPNREPKNHSNASKGKYNFQQPTLSNNG